MSLQVLQIGGGVFGKDGSLSCALAVGRASGSRSLEGVTGPAGKLYEWDVVRCSSARRGMWGVS